MAEKICLICTLGNRDIQFKKEYRDIIEKKLNDILGKNIITNGKSDTDDLIVNPKGFLESTKIIYDNYDLIKDYMFLPLIEPALNYVHDIKNIILVSTNQTEVNVDENYKKGDTFIEAKIIKKYLSEKGYNVLINEARFNASDLDEWFRHIEKIITDNADFSRLIFEISGGVPTSKEAIRLASLFKKKIEVIEVAKGRANSKNMTFFEERIIKEKIKELIYRHNYTGVLEFSEYLSDDVLKIVNHLNYRLNFDFENAINCYDEDRLKNLINEENTIKKLEYLILELLDNMEIELENGNYANFLARVYRLEEAMGQYFVLKWFEKTRTKISYKLKNNSSCGLIDAKNVGVEDLNNKLKSYLIYLLNGIKQNKYTNHKGVLKLRNFIENNCKKKDKNGNIIMRNGNVEYYININTPTYNKLINHLWGNYSNELRIYEKIQKMYKNEEYNLRHTTIVAHGFKGINKDDFKKMLENNGVRDTDIVQHFTKLNNEFHTLAGADDKNIFDKINDTIISIYYL